MLFNLIHLYVCALTNEHDQTGVQNYPTYNLWYSSLAYAGKLCCTRSMKEQMVIKISPLPIRRVVVSIVGNFGVTIIGSPVINSSWLDINKPSPSLQPVTSKTKVGISGRSLLANCSRGLFKGSLNISLSVYKPRSCKAVYEVLTRTYCSFLGRVTAGGDSQTARHTEDNSRPWRRFVPSLYLLFI